MRAEILEQDPQKTIELLQRELAETNREVLVLTLELEKRVDERTAELRAAQEELRERNGELMKRTAQLEAANKELEAFSYSVSHDLRAPVRRIDAFLFMLLEKSGSALEPAARQYIDKAVKSAREMGRLIDDLLSFSRMGRAEMREAACDFGKLVNDIVREISNDIPGRKIEWNIGPLPEVRGDPALLKQIWINLLSNAVKYTRPRNPARIEVGYVQKAQEMEFYVKDNGVGFDMGYGQKLFGVFQRLHHEDEFEGTGIGLANVQRIVNRHGGKTRAEGKVGEGATFYFTLPIQPAEDTQQGRG